MRAVGLLLVASLVLALAPGSVLVQAQGTQDPTVLAALYKTLPFQDVYPLPDGPVALGGSVRPIKIGFSQTGFNHPWRIEMINSARAEVARHPNVQIIVTDGKVDVVKQSGDIADLLAQGVDAIVMSPVEDAGLRAAARKAVSAGKPVIVLDRDVSVDKTLFMGQSNVTMAAGVARVMVEQLKKKYGKPQGNVVEITGLLGSTPAQGRHEGFESVVKQYPDIKVLATGDGQWIREPAVKLMEDWLVRFPKIDAVFSHAEESSWGAQLAIERAGRKNEGIMHFTHDSSNQGFCSVKAGLFLADGNYTPYLGHIGVRAALYTLMGRELANKKKYASGFKYDLPDLAVLTKANIEQWLGKGWGDWDKANCGKYVIP
jgi:ribose transport system substrate-binding protein